MNTYSFSIDIFKKDPQVEVIFYSIARLADGSEQINSQQLIMSNDKKKWQHVKLVNKYKKPCITASISIEIKGNGSIWLDNPEISKIPDIILIESLPGMILV